MKIKDLSYEELCAELEIREIENKKHSLKGFSQIDISKHCYMVDYNFLLLNVDTGERGELIIKVDDVDLYDYHNISKARYNDFSHLKEAYFYKTYKDAIDDYEVDLESYIDEHGRINISIFDILNCMKIICGEDEYIAVCVEDDEYEEI